MFHRCVFCSGKPIFSFTKYKQSNFASGKFFLWENPFRNASGLVSQDKTEICLACKMWVNFHVYNSWKKISREKKKCTGLKCTNHSKTFSKTFYHVHMVDSKLLDSFWCDFLSLVKCTVRLSWTHPHPFPVCVRFLPCPLWKDRMMARLSS